MKITDQKQAMQSMINEMNAMRMASGNQSQIHRKSDSFGEILSAAMASANDHQITAQQMQKQFELGDKDVDLISVMLATQKANISFQTMMQVRNRMLNAYREVMNMPM